MKRTLIAAALLLAGCDEYVPPSPEQQLENQAFRLCGAYVRAALHDPKSLEWDRRAMKYIHGEATVLVSRPFSANNLFGGRVRQTAVCVYSQGERLDEFQIN
jgi:hypothetical protein